jgi:hypothetical protein
MQNQNNEVFDIFQTNFITNFIKTVISYMHTQHYSCIDVMPKDTLVWMPHYIRHKHKGANNYVCVVL